MFTGIVENTGKIIKIDIENTNVHYTIQCDFANELKIDQSMAHDGCCLTVVNIDPVAKTYVVTAMQETLLKTNLKTWHVGYEVNLERSMKMDGRFDGHIVQGHVDQTAECVKVIDENGSWRYYFSYNADTPHFTVAKGSVSVNGVSLTVVDALKGEFSVAIIPYTYQNTNFHNLKIGSIINIEFDIFGKYIQKLMDIYMDQQK